MTILIKNRQANFSYEIIDKLMTGIVLYGNEVKSLKQGLGSLEESFVANTDSELSLLHFHIPNYQKQDSSKTDPDRPKKLLANKKEIRYFLKEKQLKGLTIIPVALHNIKGLIKVEIALAKGKKSFDKRQSIKTRDVEREIGRTLKNRK